MISIIHSDWTLSGLPTRTQRDVWGGGLLPVDFKINLTVLLGVWTGPNVELRIQRGATG